MCHGGAPLPGSQTGSQRHLVRDRCIVASVPEMPGRPTDAHRRCAGRGRANLPSLAPARHGSRALTERNEPPVNNWTVMRAERRFRALPRSGGSGIAALRTSAYAFAAPARGGMGGSPGSPVPSRSWTSVMAASSLVRSRSWPELGTVRTDGRGGRRERQRGW